MVKDRTRRPRRSAVLVASVMVLVLGVVLGARALASTQGGYNNGGACVGYCPGGLDDSKAIWDEVGLATLHAGTFGGSRAWTPGFVDEEYASADGDWHLHIANRDGNYGVVLEISPELEWNPFTLPPLHQCIAAWGIPRWDGQHGFEELHPLMGWHLSGACP